MGEPHNHHFVPAFYLKQWRGPPDKKINEYSLLEPRRLIKRRRGPDATGFQDKLYTFPELPPKIAASIETQVLKPTDDLANLALQKLLSGVQGPWTLEMRSGWTSFLFGL